MITKPKRVVLFGELLMRLDTPRHERFVQAQNFEVSYTGGEANTGALLAGFGREAALVSAVPANEIGQACINHMRRYGLSTQFVQRRGPRLGILYVECGAAQRSSKVIYDRAGSSFSQLKVGDIPWEEILYDADWLHFTGTAPALSAELAELTMQGCQAAKSMGRIVSCDLNYRSALWTVDAARATMTRLAPHIDVLIANEEHARLLLGAPPAGITGPAGIFEPDAYRSSTAWLRERFGFSHVALTLRSGTMADETAFAGLLDDGNNRHMSPIHKTRVVDRIGAGDAFTGGLIYGLLAGWEMARTVEFAAAVACLKHTMHGDFCLISLSEASAFAEHGADGRVLR